MTGKSWKRLQGSSESAKCAYLNCASANLSHVTDSLLPSLLPPHCSQHITMISTVQVNIATCRMLAVSG